MIAKNDRPRAEEFDMQEFKRLYRMRCPDSAIAEKLGLSKETASFTRQCLKHAQNRARRQRK
jgi:hypothetical protein